MIYTPAATGSTCKVSDRDDPARNAGVRNKTGNAETQRDEAKLPGHVQHDPSIGADAGVWTVVLTLAEINGFGAADPAVVRRHQNAKLRAARRSDSMRGRSLTLRAREELQKLARAATPHPDRSAFAFNARQTSHAALVCRRVQACNAVWVNVARLVASSFYDQIMTPLVPLMVRGVKRGLALPRL